MMLAPMRIHRPVVNGRKRFPACWTNESPSSGFLITSTTLSEPNGTVNAVILSLSVVIQNGPTLKSARPSSMSRTAAVKELAGCTILEPLERCVYVIFAMSPLETYQFVQM